MLAMRSARLRPLRTAANAVGRVTRVLKRGLSQSHSETTPKDDLAQLSTQHFRLSPLAHPLKAKPDRLTKAVYDASETTMANRAASGRLQNHIWSREELEEKLKEYKDVHTPTTISDHVMHSIMYYGLYHPFVRAPSARAGARRTAPPTPSARTLRARPPRRLSVLTHRASVSRATRRAVGIA
jgi:hypothetical protein